MGVGEAEEGVEEAVVGGAGGERGLRLGEVEEVAERGVERVKVAAAPSASAVQKLIDRRSNKGRAGIAVRTP